VAAGPGIPGPRGGRRPSTKRLSSDIERAYRESENAARTQSPRVSVPSATGSFSAGSFNSRASCLHRSARAASSTFPNSAAWLVVVGLPFAAGQRTEGHQVLEPCLRVLLQVVGQESVAARVGSGGVPGRKSTRPGANGVVELTPFEFLAPPGRSRAATAEPPASLPRGVCAASHAQAGRHGARHREHWQVSPGRD